MLRASGALLRLNGTWKKHKTRGYRTYRWEQRASPRRNPALPTLTARAAASREVALDQYEELHESGVALMLDEQLPPWKRRSAYATMAESESLRFKFGRVKVRTVPTQPTPGFSTHWN